MPRARILLLAALALAAARASAEVPVYRVSASSRVFEGYAASYEALAVSPDGSLVATGDQQRRVVLWDAARGRPARVLTGHEGTVFAVVFSPDGKRLLSASADGTLRLWDAAGGAALGVIRVSSRSVFAAAISPDGSKALTGDEDGATKLWSLTAPGAPVELGRGKVPVVAVDFALGGRLALSVDLDNRLGAWDAGSGRRAFRLERRGHPLIERFVSPDGRALLYAGSPPGLRDAGTGARLRDLEQGEVTGDLSTRGAFSRDGTLCVVESARQHLGLWDRRGGRLLREFDPPGHARRLAFSADGRTLLGVFGGVPAPVEWRVVPEGRPAAPEAASAPVLSTAALADLGSRLFFDKRLSRDRTVSCATCHDPRQGWSDHRPVSVGVGGRLGRRHAPSLLNARFHEPTFWDGRAQTLEEQVAFPLADQAEMGSSIEQAARTVAGIPGYGPLFRLAFGDPEATPGRLAAAIAAFERSLVSLDSPYDRYAAGRTAALDAAQRRGLDVFMNKGRCFICHELAPSTHQQYLNIGVSTGPDSGRFEVTRADEDLRAFRVPDLHDVSYAGPYMHDGSLLTLADVVDFYDRGGGADQRKGPWVTPLGLTAAEKRDLVRFLEALGGDRRLMAAPEMP